MSLDETIPSWVQMLDVIECKANTTLRVVTIQGQVEATTLKR